MAEDQRRHQLHILLLSFMVSLVISGIIIIVMLMNDQMTEHWLARL